jgi:hypothetical protein
MACHTQLSYILGGRIATASKLPLVILLFVSPLPLWLLSLLLQQPQRPVGTSR